MYGYFPRYFWQISIITPMEEPLFNAIFNRFAATPVAEELTALYNTEASDKAIFPYATVALPTSSADWTFTENSEVCIIQFSLFSETPTCEEILDGATALKAAFDFFDLNVDGYETISLVRLNASLFRVKKKWHWTVTYQLKMQKT